MDLKDKVVLVTGSTRGIGAATALAFAKAGSRVILHGRHPLGEDIKDRLTAVNARYAFLTADLANPTALKQFAKDAWDQYGQIDVVVNNAGINNDKLLVSMNQADFDSVINVNLRSPFLLTQALLKKMYKQQHGCIINLASVVGLHGNIGQANYAASKAGIIGLTKTTAREGALRGIRCNAIAPGMIQSDMTAALSSRAQQQILNQIPANRFGTVNEVAQTAIFLAQNDYITGQTIVVDGGMTI